MHLLSSLLVLGNCGRILRVTEQPGREQIGARLERGARARMDLERGNDDRQHFVLQRRLGESEDRFVEAFYRERE